MKQLKVFLKNLLPITDQQVEQSMHYFSTRKLSKGDYFVRQGKICKQIAFINSGSLRTFYINEKAEETTSCFCIENNLTTSYKSFIQQSPSELSIQAIEDTELLIINYDNLQKLYSTSPIWQNIGRLVAEKEYFVMEQYASVLSNLTAKEKYMRLLEEQPNVLQRANIEDIASYLGVTRRTLSRIRQELSK